MLSAGSDKCLRRLGVDATTIQALKSCPALWDPTTKTAETPRCDMTVLKLLGRIALATSENGLKVLVIMTKPGTSIRCKLATYKVTTIHE